MDPRYVELANLLVGYSTKVQKGERVLLQTDVSVPHDMNRAVIEAVRAAGGILLDPLTLNPRLSAEARIGCTNRQLRIDAAAYLVRTLGADVRIGLRGYLNPLEMGRVPTGDSMRYEKEFTGFVLEEAIEGTRWVLTEWPTPGFALLAGLPTTDAEDMFFDAVLEDYETMAQNVVPLVQLMEQTKNVRITGPGKTNLTFSIDGIPVVACVGEKNIPDGEVYTAPVLHSMNGLIEYRTPAITKTGERFENVWFEVKDGKIINAGCGSGDVDRLNAILNTDEGARFFGEWSLGINWRVRKVIGDTLFDEKVGGTFHLTPGKSYDDAPNGNQSAVHWDLVCDQRESAGGGEIWFDDVLVRKDGLFVPEEVAGLNPKQ